MAELKRVKCGPSSQPLPIYIVSYLCCMIIIVVGVVLIYFPCMHVCIVCDKQSPLFRNQGEFTSYIILRYKCYGLFYNKNTDA